jgi:hypothetical protein
MVTAIADVDLTLLPVRAYRRAMHNPARDA